ncbi:MAG: glycosyltransferase [Candidatus Korobacteraceae bacterium]
MQTAIIFRDRLLAPTETFILGQAQSLLRYKPVLAGLRRSETVLQHSLPEILLRPGSGILDKLVVRAARYVPLAGSFYRRLRAVSPSIIHAHFAIDGVLALPVANALDLPLVVSLHGYDVTPPDAHFRQSAAGRYYLAHREELFARASAFICVSQSIRETALRRGFPEEKLHVHYTGVNCEFFDPGTVKRDPKLILFVGRLVETKGCEFVIRAMAQVRQKDPLAHLEIIGDGPLRAELESLAKRLAVRVKFVGVQKPEAVRRSMMRARVLCNPSVTAEGFGMVFAEAQFVGTPVVSSMHSAIPEAVNNGETGLLCPERMPGPIADALLTFLGDDVFWNRASGRATTWVRENFDIAKQAVKLEQLYDECQRQWHESQAFATSPFPGQSPMNLDSK